MASTVYPSAKKGETNKLNGTANGTTSSNSENIASLVGDTAWHSTENSKYHFGSDTATTPSAAMLQSVLRTTLLDDVFREDTTTNNFEAEVSSLFGHEAGLMVLSGTMGNQLGLRAALNTGPPHSIVCDSRAHIMRAEAGGVASLSQAILHPVLPSDKAQGYLSLEDVQSDTILDSDVHNAPTKVIALENTLAGVIFPLAEVQRISSWARSQSPPIHMHLDGARIWEAVAAQVAEGQYANAGDTTSRLKAGLLAYGKCFDSIQMCFSKGLGAPIGSMLVSSTDLIQRARHMRKAIGGGVRAMGVLSAPARVAVHDTFFGGKLVQTHKYAMRIAKFWENRGGKVVNNVQTNMVWLDLKAAGVSGDEFESAGEKEGIQIWGAGRIVVHYQICEEAIERLERVMAKLLEKR